MLPRKLAETAGTHPARESKTGDRSRLILDVPVAISIELGRTRVCVEGLLEFRTGSVIKLDKPAGEPLDIYANQQLVARGEAVIIGDHFGVRIIDVVAPEERLDQFKTR